MFGRVKLDPAPTKTQYEDWERTATRPLTQASIGAHSGHVRARCARLSKLWTPEKSLRMFRRVQTEIEKNSPEGGSRPGRCRDEARNSSSRHRPGRVGRRVVVCLVALVGKNESDSSRKSEIRR